MKHTCDTKTNDFSEPNSRCISDFPGPKLGTLSMSEGFSEKLTISEAMKPK